VKKKRRIQQSDMLWGSAVIMLVILQFWWLPGEKGTAADSYSATIDGKLGLYRTLSELFPDVVRDPINLLPERQSTVLLIAPDRYPTDREEHELAEYVRGGGTLLFAPNWSQDECDLPELGIDITPNDWLAEVSTAVTPSTIPSSTPAQSSTSDAESSDASDLPAEAPDATSSGDGATTNPPAKDDENKPSIPAGEANLRPQNSPVAGIQSMNDEQFGERTVTVSASSRLVAAPIEWRKTSSISPPRRRLTYETLVQSGDDVNEVLTWKMGAGRVVACSSADVFSNRSMLDSDSRRLAVRLVEICHQSPYAGELASRPIVICEFLTASEAYRHAGVLLSPALRIGSLQLMLLAVLAGWSGFHRFGPAKVARAEQRRNLTDSAIAVGNLQYRLHDGGNVVHEYMDYVNTDLRRKFGGSVQLDNIEVLAHRAGASVDYLKDQLAKADDLQKKQGVSAPVTAKCIRWLARLKQRVTTPTAADHQANQDSPTEDS
jgi:Domain of unknown function (DUF4350)